MIKAIIVDDESKARSNLSNLLEEYCKSVEVVASVENIKDGMAAIAEHQPQLVFLDVRMQNETGFDILDQLDTINFEIIFVTAHDQYAINAFKFSAVDYIMKPINIDLLVEAVGKAEKRIEQNTSRENYELLKQNHSSATKEKKIAIPTSEGVLFIKVKDIVRCQADGSYTHIHIQDGKKITVSKILKEYDELLREHNFLRVHQSHLINLEHMIKYVSAKGGHVEMSDGSLVGISRNYKEAFVNKVSQL